MGNCNCKSASFTETGPLDLAASMFPPPFLPGLSPVITLFPLVDSFHWHVVLVPRPLPPVWNAMDRCCYDERSNITFDTVLLVRLVNDVFKPITVQSILVPKYTSASLLTKTSWYDAGQGGTFVTHAVYEILFDIRGGKRSDLRKP